MAVDVTSEVEIARPRAEVAAYACDPDNATAWYENIEAVEWRTPPPLAVGSRIAMTLRNRGFPSGFPRLLAPLVARAMRRANRGDLRRLRSLLEGR